MTYNVFSGTLNPTHFTSPVPISLYRGQIWLARLYPWSPLMCQISSGLGYCVALEGRKNNFYRIFSFNIMRCYHLVTWRHTFVTFPNPTVSKAFPYFGAFMAKSLEQMLPFKSVTDKQRSNFFAPPQRHANSEPHRIRHDDGVPFLHIENFLASDAQFRRWKYGGKSTPDIKRHNSGNPSANFQN